MVRVPQLLRSHILPNDIVFAVGRRQHDRLGPGKLEYRPFERLQSRRVEVLDHFDQGGRVEALEPPIAICERPM